VPAIAAIEGRAHVHSDYALLASVVVAADGATFQDVVHFSAGVAPGGGIFTTWSYRAGGGRAEALLLNPLPARTAHETSPPWLLCIGQRPIPRCDGHFPMDWRILASWSAGKKGSPGRTSSGSLSMRCSDRLHGTPFAAWKQSEICEEHNEIATTSLIEKWIDETERPVSYTG
jgi:hypothetical protein